MERSINVSGNGKSLVIDVDGQGSVSFDPSQDIKAEELFNALAYSKGDKYVVARGNRGDVSEGAFVSFCKLLEEIAEGIGKLSID